MEDLIEKGGDVAYDKRLSLGILLEIPTDKSLSPDYMRNMQANFAGNPMGEPSTPGMESRKISSTGLQRLEIAEREKTPTQDAMDGNPGD